MRKTRSKRSRSTRLQRQMHKGGNIPDGAVVIVRDPEDPQSPPVAMSYETAKDEIFHESNNIEPSIRPRRRLTKEQIAAMQAGRKAARARRLASLE